MRNIKLPALPFVSDGCSGGLSNYWRAFTGCGPTFEYCCFDHDVEYHFGAGEKPNFWVSFKERLYADNKLFVCLWQNGLIGKALSLFVWLAVRIGGGAYLPTAYRWGFGWANQNKK